MAPSGPDPKPVARTPRGRKALKRTYIKKHLPENRADWVTRREAHFAEHPNCEFPHDLVDAGECRPPYDAQHVTARGMGGRKDDTSRLVTLCRNGHTYTEEHRTWARANGLAVHIWEAS